MFWRRTSVVFLALLVVSAPVVGARVAGAGEASKPIQLEWAMGGIPGPILGPAAEAIERGPLPYDAAELAEQKALAASEAGQVVARPSAATPKPTVLIGKKGVFDTTGAPSDSTGTIGAKRYIETINRKVGIYDLNLKLIKQDSLANWWVMAGANCFDPQVMWDATTNRFYYAGDAVFSSADNRLVFGFSKTDSPNNAVEDWCHYYFPYGAEFPDYPKLGDSKDFAIIGVNVFTDTFRGSDIVAFSKPAAGAACPDPATFKVGRIQNIVAGGAIQFTPTPASSIDSKGTGWVVSRSGGLPAATIGLFKVTKDAATGYPVISAPGSTITVPSYSAPPNAPQKDTAFLIDTLDARLTQAVAAVDPKQGNKFTLWTQHTISGGAGSMVRWYEIDPAGKTVLQTGDVKNGALYYFNAAISPDRVVRGSTKAYGANMMLQFSASSADAYPSIRMVAKRGADKVSSAKVVKSSPGPNIDFACQSLGHCRWGDYAAASPDPNAPTGGAAGIVWGTNMWTKDGRITGVEGVSWQTWNWKSQP